MFTLEALEGFRLTCQALAGFAPLVQDEAQGIRHQLEVGGDLGIAAQDLDDGLGGADGDFLAQGDGLLDDVLGDAPWLVSIGTHLRLEGLEAAFTVARVIAPDGFGVDGGAFRIGDLVGLGSASLDVSINLAPFEGMVQQRRDKAIAEEGDLGSLLLFRGQWTALFALHSLPPDLIFA